jgi:hypothetical protein
VTQASLLLPDGTERPLSGDTFVGRDEVNQVQLDDETVSRRHALIVTRERKWWIADTGSFNGTFLNEHRLPPGVALQLRHADRIRLGSQVVVFSCPTQLEDPDRTEPHEHLSADGEGAPLSAFQLQVVRCLCEPWLAGGSLDELPTNEEIAARLGTPGSTGTVKSALRRAYSKTGLTGRAAHTKRRELCRLARQRGWL